MMGYKIPATIITGFLGSGKTTLLQNLLKTAHGKKLAFIINEFGDKGFDGKLVKECGIEGCDDNSIIELSNGCICCTVADDFVPTLNILLSEKIKPDHIIIETSGLALPKPLVQAFNWPDISHKVTVDGVITVLDAPAIAEGRFVDNIENLDQQKLNDPNIDHDNPVEELFEDQLACADLVILNKIDKINDKTLDDINKKISPHLRSGVKVLRATYAAIDSQILLGLAAETEKNIHARKSHHDFEENHDHKDFASFSLTIPVINDLQNFLQKIEKIITHSDVLRIKGFIAVADKNMRLVIQAVGKRIHHYYDRDWKKDEEKKGYLVIIGMYDLDQASITQTLM
ncbi:MAG: cobalamin biosynthesis protein CobW [Alphaproteobacteria bacterium]|nr:cobalamin biosynthesis protein CobW [Alphaproteobacteria bacterium]